MTEELSEKFQQLSDIDDVGEKRYQMFKVFDKALEELEKNNVKELNGFDGYLYKLSQDFLTTSSTYEKEQKLERIVDRVKKKYL